MAVNNIVVDLMEEAIDFAIDAPDLPESVRFALKEYKLISLAAGTPYTVQGFSLALSMSMDEAIVNQIELVALRDTLTVIKTQLVLAMIAEAAENGPYTQEDFDIIKEGIKATVDLYFAPTEAELDGYIYGLGVNIIIGEASGFLENFAGSLGDLTAAVVNMAVDDFKSLFGFEQCFLPHTSIAMADGSTKPIEMIVPDDMVMSYDKAGNLVPGRVTRTKVNTVKYVLDMFGTGVTPGHVYLCGDGEFAGKHVPLIDILRSDGAIIREDGTLIRAATSCEVGSFEDTLIWAITGERSDAGIAVRESAKIRLGTRVITKEGNDISIAEIVQSMGCTIEDDLIKPTPDSDGIPFHWQFSAGLPKPEDYVLQRSALTLNEIYQAAEWEDVQPQMPTPFAKDTGAVFSNLPKDIVESIPPNIPLSFVGTPLEPHMTRKQRRAYAAKVRKSNKNSIQVMN